MRNILAILLKQIKETFRNKSILIQFIMFPAMALVMENAIKLDNMPEHFFARLFAVMFVGMAPLTCMSSIISEEKEKNTLRVLMMSNVRPWQYLIGTGGYIFAVCMLGVVVFALCCQCLGGELALFLAVMAAGILISIMVGAVIGICCKKQMTATSITVPVMMVFSFMPMLSMFNESIERVARFTYSQQVSLMLGGADAIEPTGMAVLAANFIIAVAAFAFAYRKKGLEC